MAVTTPANCANHQLSGILGRCTAITMAVTKPASSLSAKKGRCPQRWHRTQPGSAPPSQRRCTPPLAVLAPALAPLGQVQVGTTLGVAVPPEQPAALGLPAGHRHRSGGAPSQGWRCHPGSTPSPVLPPLLYQLLLLCKCANTTK